MLLFACVGLIIECSLLQERGEGKEECISEERTVDVMLSDVNESADVVVVKSAAAESTKEPIDDFMVLRLLIV